jgi:hypothetical protein
MDGLIAPRHRAAERRKRGLRLALTALLLAGMLEVVLVLRAAARARARLAQLAEATDAAMEESAGGGALGPRGSAGILVLLVVTLLGFALIAALLAVRNG